MVCKPHIADGIRTEPLSQTSCSKFSGKQCSFCFAVRRISLPDIGALFGMRPRERQHGELITRYKSRETTTHNAEDGALHGDQSALTTGRPARDQLAAVWVRGATKQVVEGLADLFPLRELLSVQVRSVSARWERTTDHKRLRDVGTAVKDCARVAQQSGKCAVSLRDASNKDCRLSELRTTDCLARRGN